MVNTGSITNIVDPQFINKHRLPVKGLKTLIKVTLKEGT